MSLTILFVDALLAHNAILVVLAAIERLRGAYGTRTLGAREALLVKVLALEHQIRLIGRYDAVAFRAFFALLARETLHTIRLLLLIRIDALTYQLETKNILF